MNHVVDPDAELTAWYEVQAADAHQAYLDEEANHRCPADMPPCPNCQAKEEVEDEREFGFQ